MGILKCYIQAAKSSLWSRLLLWGVYCRPLRSFVFDENSQSISDESIADAYIHEASATD